MTPQPPIILVVEDDPAFGSVLGHMLQALA